MIFYMPGISYINPYFRAPRPPKPLKSRPQGQNLPGFLLRSHSGGGLATATAAVWTHPIRWGGIGNREPPIIYDQYLLSKP